MKRNLPLASLFLLSLSIVSTAQISNLDDWLAINPANRPALETLDFSSESLTETQAESAKNLLLTDKQTNINNLYSAQWDNRLLNYGIYQMPFFYNKFGSEPQDGRSLFISMHGGGSGAPSQNDAQYNNQKNLYNATMNNLEGVYLAVRAPTNVWNLWHLDHVDEFFNLIIQMAVIKENVNPNKVYLMGYSAGGDGVYQLAPRMSDRWAAAAMMAGHPNETSSIGLRNLPFTIHMGGDDSAFNRNLVAAQWGVDLGNLQSNDPEGYIHDVNIYPGVGHWMSLRDAVALPWMQNFKRNPIPEKIVWKQDDVHHSTFYWLGVPDDEIVTGGEVVVEYDQVLNEINILENYSNTLNIYINDDMLNLDAPISVKYQGQELFEGLFPRSVLAVSKSLAFKGDANLAFSSELTVTNNEVVTGGVLVTSTTELAALNSIKVYPNPLVNDKLTVAFPSRQFEQMTILVTDAQGNEVKQLETTELTNEIDLSGLPKAVYFVKIEGGGQSYVHKIVKT